MKSDIREVMAVHTPNLMSLTGVVGVYIGETEKHISCIKVMVVELNEDLKKKIPEELDGYPVVIDVTGKIKPMNI